MSIFSVGGSTPSDSAVESKSLRFQADEHYLSRAFNQDGNRQTFTISCWVKFTDMDASRQLFGTSTNANIGVAAWPGMIVSWDPTTTNTGISLEEYNGSSYNAIKQTANLLRDPSAWYHLVIRYDTTNAVAANRIRIYINGTEATYAGTNTSPAQNYESYWNDNKTHRIGKGGSSNGDFGGYMAEFYSVDGQSLDPSSFAETDSDTNQWKPRTAEDIKAEVTFGVNGFYLPFSNDALAASFTDSTKYTVESFTSTGTTSWTAPSGVTSVEYLVVAGGGAGGGGVYGGGGGAGGMKTGTHSVTPGQSYTVTVGAGGTATSSGSTSGGDGGDSVFDSITSTGGGGGGGSGIVGRDGGSGGGGGGQTGNPAGGSASPAGQGNDGGAGISLRSGGGGGGAGAVGSAGGNSGRQGGVGGDGLQSNITGTNTYYAGGGGGGSYNQPGGTGGQGGGGTGDFLNPAGSGTPNTGGGGGGASTSGGTTGAGGSGIVIIRYLSTTGTVSRHTITANGDAKNERIQPNARMVAAGNVHIIGPKVGSSAIWFDGSGDYLSAPDHADWALGSGDFTLEAWVNTNAKADQVLFSQYEDSSNRWYLRLDERDGQQGIGFYDIDGGIDIEASDGTWPGINQWVHMAFVRSSGVIKIYIDGSEVTLKTNTNPSASWGNYAATLRIGDYNGGNNFDGYLDEIRISNSARYTSNFTPSTTAFSSDANTKLLIHSNTTMGSTTFTDSGTNSHTITANGNVKHVAPKIGTGMGVWDGVLSPPTYIETEDAPGTWAFGTEDFTWDFWCYSDGWTNNETFYEAYYSSTDRWELRIKTGGDLALTSIVGGSTVVDVNFDNANMPTGAWFHLEISREGSTFRCFVNGTETGDSQTSSGSLGTTPRQLKVGRSGQHNTVWKGYMDEHRISKGVVRHTSNFTPSTTAYTDDKDTVLLMHMDGGGPGAPGSDTNIGQGIYFYDDSTNALFYDSGVPKYKSVISFDGTGDYLHIPSSSDFQVAASNSESFTLECWVKLDLHDDQETFMALSDSGASLWRFRNYHGNGVSFQVYNSGSLIVDVSGAEIADTDWHHVALVKVGNGSDSTYTLYKDGTSVGTTTDADTYTVPDSSASAGLDIGASNTAGDPLQGYMDEIRISNTARYTANFTPPTDRFTADANTKLLIQSDFSDGGLGADHSGNYNYFTPTNLGAHDMVEDSPTNNFATLNPLVPTTPTLSEGNLKGASTSTSTVSDTAATFSPTSGKWYWEICLNQLNLDNSTGYVQFNIGGGAYIWSYYNTPTTQIVANTTTAISNFSAGDILQFAVDIDNGKAWFGNNGTWYTTSGTPNPSAGTGQAYTFTYSGDFWSVGMARFQMRSGSGTQIATCNFGQDSSFAGNKTAQGNTDGNNKGDFYYTPPSGYLALCTDNLPTPSIADPTAHFNTKLYTGTGSELAVTGVGFQPDFTWIKTRTLTYNHRVFDVVRGVTKELEVNQNNPEITDDAQTLKSFDSDGFTLGTSAGVNPSSNSNMVSWNWKGGGTASSNSDGTITSSVSANPTAGFSVLTYTGTGSNATVGHGLSQTPQHIIVKRRDGTGWSWYGYNETLGNTKSVTLNHTSVDTNSAVWNDTSPTASVFTVGTAAGVNGSSGTFVAYCFHSVDGYSKVGSYTGNGNADGAFIYTGFRPIFVLLRDTSAAEDWVIHDTARAPYNQSQKVLYPNTSGAEEDSSNRAIDIVSNGFKARNIGGRTNRNGDTYIYYVVGYPFKTANAR